jgi:hypothetical protein
VTETARHGVPQLTKESAALNGLQALLLLIAFQKHSPPIEHSPIIVDRHPALGSAQLELPIKELGLIFPFYDAHHFLF